MTKFNPNSAPKPSIFEDLLNKLKGTFNKNKEEEILGYDFLKKTRFSTKNYSQNERAESAQPQKDFNTIKYNPNGLSMRKNAQGVYKALTQAEIEYEKLTSTDRAWYIEYDKNGGRKFIPQYLMKNIRKGFANMDDKDFEDRFVEAEDNEDFIDFSSIADKKFKLYYIFNKSNLVLSTEVKSYLYQIIQNTDLNMFSNPEKLTSHLRKEFNWTSYEISIEDLLTISDILLDKNLK